MKTLSFQPRDHHDNQDGRNDHPYAINPAFEQYEEARRRLLDAVIADDLVQEAARRWPWTMPAGDVDKEIVADILQLWGIPDASGPYTQYDVVMKLKKELRRLLAPVGYVCSIIVAVTLTHSPVYWASSTGASAWIALAITRTASISQPSTRNASFHLGCQSPLIWLRSNCTNPHYLDAPSSILLPNQSRPLE